MIFGTESHEYFILPLEIGRLTFRLHINTIVYSWVIMLILVGISVSVYRHWKLVPKGMSIQNLIEFSYEFILNLCKSLMPEDKAEVYAPFIYTIFIFILFSNWFGLVPAFLPYQIQPTSDYSTTLALALISLLAYNCIAIRELGFRQWLIHFIHPMPLIMRYKDKILYILSPFLLIIFLVINFSEIFARGLSLSVRLFGNIYGEHHTVLTLIHEAITMKSAISLVFIAISIFVSAVGILAGLIQALIFAVLTGVYIGGYFNEEG